MQSLDLAARRLLALSLALACALSLALAARTTRADATHSPGDLVAQLAPGNSADAAHELAAGPFPVEQLGAELDRLAKAGEPARVNDTLRAVQKAAGARYWAADFDLVAALVALGDADADAYRALLGTACILQALAKDGSPIAVARIVAAAPDHGWMLRFEVARRLQALGEKAIAPLILARGHAELRGFATATLDHMGKKVPGDAVQTKSNEVLADILRAYGTTKDLDALGAVVSFVGSDRDVVRGAAREATLAYGDAALSKLRETFGNVQGKPVPDDWTADRIARALFAALDRQRFADVDALVDDGLSKAEHGDAAGAVASFDKALARQPLLARRAGMAPAYVQYARSIEEADAAGATAAYRKALDLDPTGPHAPQVHAELAALEGEALLARGIEDRAPFEHALSFDPSNAKARAALERMDTDARAREDRARKWTWSALAAAGFLALLVLFARLPRRFRL